MAIIIATIAFLLCWIWIEITLYFTSKNAREKNTVKRISYKKFIWILRILLLYYLSEQQFICIFSKILDCKMQLSFA